LFGRPRRWLVVTALCVAAAACGGDTTVASTTATTIATTPTTVATTTTPAPSTTMTPSDGFPVTVAASNGAIEIPERPERIVSLSPTHTEMLYAIGAGDQVYAVDMFSNHPEGTPTTELTGFTPNVEALVEWETDLVVIDGDWDGTSVAALTELGIPVLVLEAAIVFDDVYDQIEALGVATGNPAAAQDLVADMRGEIDEILAGITPTDEPRTFYHELDTTYFSVTSGTFIGTVYAAMGLENIADAVGEGASYTQLSEEFIIEQDPDFIFLADTICCGVDAESVAERPGWGTLQAVDNGTIVELSDDVASRWGPRIVDYMRQVADALAMADG
jgi:iron complex transport system substrate-binding protein